MSKTIENFLEENDKFVIGVSGGVDSILLLDTMVKKYKEKVVVAHVNHGFRHESEEEYEFVENLCDSYGVKFVGCKLNVNKYKEDNNIQSDESAARDLRYDFYEKVLKSEGTNILLLGHHGDDLVEGVLMRLISGANGKGLISMTSVHQLKDSLIVLRPLLEKTKNDIYAEAKSLNLEWREDVSNKEDKYTRNRYRNHLLPFVKKENENVHKNFIRFSEIKKEEEEYFDTIVKNKLMSEVLYNDGMYLVEKSYWNNENIVIKRRMLSEMLNCLGLEYNSITVLEMLEEKLGGKYNTDYNLLLKGVYVVNTSDKFYLVSSTKREELDNGYGFLKVNKDMILNGRKVSKVFKDRKVPVAFRKYVSNEGNQLKDILGNIL